MKINPSHLLAYRRMEIQTNPVVRSGQVDSAAVGRSGKVKDSAGIEGSRFLSYLSKSEQQYLAERFPATRPRTIHAKSSHIGKTRGLHLDIKA